MRVRISVKGGFLETVWPAPWASRRGRDTQMFTLFQWRLHLSTNSQVAHPDCSSSRDNNHESQPLKIVCFGAPRIRRGGSKFDGYERWCEIRLFVYLPRKLSSNRGKHRAYFKEKGALSLGSSRKQKGLSGTWSKLNTNNQTQNSVKRWVLS